MNKTKFFIILNFNLIFGYVLNLTIKDSDTDSKHGSTASPDVNYDIWFNTVPTFECVNVDYDFLIYSLEWQTNSGNLTKFLTQGLRGSFVNSTRPIQCCSDQELNLSNLTSILTKLKKIWVHDPISDFNDSLKEEWNIYTSCIEKSKTKLKIFDKMIKLNEKFELEQWLKQDKIIPSNTKTYSLDKFNKSIYVNLNKTFNLKCEIFGKIKKVSIFHSIDICLNKTTYDTINCPSKFKSNCLDNIYFPNSLFKHQESFVYDGFYYNYDFLNYHHSYILLDKAYVNIKRVFLTKPKIFYNYKKINYDKLKDLNVSTYSQYIKKINISSESIDENKFKPWYNSSNYSKLFTPCLMNLKLDELLKNNSKEKANFKNVYYNYYHRYGHYTYLPRRYHYNNKNSKSSSSNAGSGSKSSNSRSSSHKSTSGTKGRSGGGCRKG